MIEEPIGTCSVCRRRDPEFGLVCPGCRSRLAGWLRELPDLYADLVARDDVLRSSAGHGHVSGTHEAPVPIRVDAVDLTADARVLHLASLPAREDRLLPCRYCRAYHPAGSYSPLGPHESYDDQAGHLSVASVLDGWVRDWREHRDRGEGLPDPLVPTLCRWLGDRLEDACDDHPAIGDFAEELRELRRALYGQLGLFDVPDYKQGVPCRACDMLTLVRHSGSEYTECSTCGLLLSADEYGTWVALLAAHLRDDRSVA